LFDGKSVVLTRDARPQIEDHLADPPLHLRG